MATLTKPRARQLPPVVSRRLPLIGHLLGLRRDSDILLRRGLAEHGPVFTIGLPGGQDAVVLLGKEYSDIFFGKQFGTRDAVNPLKRMFGDDIYGFATTESYEAQKTILKPRFAKTLMERYVTVMNDEIDAFVENLGESGEFEVTDTFGPVVLRVAARAFLGDCFAAEMSGDFFALFRDFSDGIGFKPSWSRAVRRSDAAGARLKAEIAAMITRRREHPQTEPDFLHELATATDDNGSPFPIHVLVGIVMIVLFAGHETTTGHAAWALLELLQHPDAFTRVRDEIDEHYTSDILDMPGWRQLKFTQAVITEAGRKDPVAPLLARAVDIDVDIAVDGKVYTLPAGTPVFTSPSVAHHMPDQFPDRPEEFVPERFLGPDADTNRSRLIDFGRGAHACLGHRFAELEMTILLRRLIRNLELELTTGTPTHVLATASQWPASPCRIKYRKRQLAPTA